MGHGVPIAVPRFPWKLRPQQRGLTQPAATGQDVGSGLAPIVAVPAAPHQGRRRYVAKRDLERSSYTSGCPACTELAVGARVAKVAHNDECRSRIERAMEEDDALAAGERLRRHREAEVLGEPLAQPAAGDEIAAEKPAAQAPSASSAPRKRGGDNLDDGRRGQAARERYPSPRLPSAFVPRRRVRIATHP